MPDFIQQGAIAALEPERGGAFTRQLIEGLGASRARLIAGLHSHNAVELPEADGAMYAFFRINGYDDDMKLAYDLLQDVGLGLAPGSAFGGEGEGWLRWCFAASPEKIDDGLARLSKFLAR